VVTFIMQNENKKDNSVNKFNFDNSVVSNNFQNNNQQQNGNQKKFNNGNSLNANKGNHNKGQNYKHGGGNFQNKSYGYNKNNNYKDSSVTGFNDELRKQNDDFIDDTEVLGGVEDDSSVTKVSDTDLDSNSEVDDLEENKSVVDEKKSDKDIDDDDDDDYETTAPRKIDFIEKMFGKRVHVSFEARVGLSILFILLLFVWACILILQAMNYGKTETISYSENSAISYKVCVSSVDYYPNTCLNEGLEYVTAITDKITTNFKYEADFSGNINYDLSYHVAIVTRIFDSANSKKVLYKDEELLVDKRPIKVNNKKAIVDEDVDIDYRKINNFVLTRVNEYATYGVNSSASLEVVLYLDEPKETRKVSSAVISLGKPTFGLIKNVLSNSSKEIEIENNHWNYYNIICAVVGSLLIIVALLILFRLTKLVLKVTSKKNEYQSTLARILRDYDRLIVVARNGFVTNRDKAITKVDSFEELLDARNTLNRPIIYSKINEVKSEFIVEDDDRIYKYVMKEADFSH